LVPGVPAWSQGLAAGIGTLRETKPVHSWYELRQGTVVRQRWDLSCGAAALSTVLTYDLGLRVSETEIVVWILHRSDPVKIQARGGFSLFDLKRFAAFRGFESEGYAELTLEELQALGRPAIVATRINGFNHFMVFRGVFSNRVVLADPSFGTATMSIQQFQDIWAKGIAFVVLPHNGQAPTKLAPKRTDLLVADLNSVYRDVVAPSMQRESLGNSVLRNAVEATINPNYYNFSPLSGK
jgi:predicted double-glycine peptidase